MSKTGRLAAGVVAIGVGLFGGGLWVFVQRGISARAEPWAVEAFVARRLRHLAIPRGAREMVNPVPATPQVLASARAHWADHCASCHSNDGSGNTELGLGLYPPAPDMQMPGTQELSDGELFYIIRNGIRFTGMPAWGSGPPDTDEESWGLVRFIRHLPEVSPEELEEMGDLNPVSRRELEEKQEIRRFLEGADEPSEHRH
jgi:mono/diheme cytochrome c family protein